MISSGYRSPELNKAIGGSENSKHCHGMAADFECRGARGASNLEVAHWIRDNLTYDQLILEYYDGRDPYSGWVHVAFNKGKNRQQTLTKVKGVPYTAGLPPAS